MRVHLCAAVAAAAFVCGCASHRPVVDVTDAEELLGTWHEGRSGARLDQKKDETLVFSKSTLILGHGPSVTKGTWKVARVRGSELTIEWTPDFAGQTSFPAGAVVELKIIFRDGDTLEMPGRRRVTVFKRIE